MGYKEQKKREQNRPLDVISNVETFQPVFESLVVKCPPQKTTRIITNETLPQEGPVTFEVIAVGEKVEPVIKVGMKIYIEDGSHMAHLKTEDHGDYTISYMLINHINILGFEKEVKPNIVLN